MTGLAFAHILDELAAEPNGGPPEQEVFRLARNIGVDVQGLHVLAEGDQFHNLQKVAWENAQLAINNKQPVFAKNLDIENQTSVVYAYDETGYYTYSWHSGYEGCDDVIPWQFLGRSHCPCIHCVHRRLSSQDSYSPPRGLISLHWAAPCEPIDERTSCKEALEFVIRLNEEGTYQWLGKTYWAGSEAYERWLNGIERNKVDQYFFSLFIEILYEARSHAVMFLTEIKERKWGINGKGIDAAIHTYGEIASGYKTLKELYPYREPRESEIEHKEVCISVLTKVYRLEREALTLLKKIYADL